VTANGELSYSSPVVVTPTRLRKTRRAFHRVAGVTVGREIAATPDRARQQPTTPHRSQTSWRRVAVDGSTGDVAMLNVCRAPPTNRTANGGAAGRVQRVANGSLSLFFAFLPPARRATECRVPLFPGSRQLWRVSEVGEGNITTTTAVPTTDRRCPCAVRAWWGPVSLRGYGAAARGGIE